MSESKKKPSWAEVFEVIDKDPLPDDFMEDRDFSLPQVREDWEPEHDDEPRVDGKSSLDLFRESCEVAEAEEQREKEIQSGVDSAVVEATATGFSAYTPKFPGCIGTGPTRAATLANLREALALHIQDKAADAAREAGRRLIALGGTAPEIEDVPRRKGEAADAAKQREKESNDHDKET